MKRVKTSFQFPATLHLTISAFLYNIIGFSTGTYGNNLHMAQEVLQHPGVNVVFQRGNSYICGIESKKSVNVLQGKGQIVGVLFRPGAFHCYFQAPVSTLTDQVVNISDYFSLEINTFEKELFALKNKEAKIMFVDRL